MQYYFRLLAQKVAGAMGSAWAFATALFLILAWLLSGPFFHFSDTWQLVINTATTIITFLMVFLIQNTQNRDAKVIHLKLDELLRALEPARTAFVDLEDFSDEQIREIEAEFHSLHEKYGTALSPLRELLYEHTAREKGKRERKRDHEKRKQQLRT